VKKFLLKKRNFNKFKFYLNPKSFSSFKENFGHGIAKTVLRFTKLE